MKGRELDKLKDISADVAGLLSEVEGTQDVSDGIDEKALEMRLVVDKKKAMEHQLTTAQIFQYLQSKLAQAKSATTLSTDTKDYPVMVISDSDEELTRELIKNCPLREQTRMEKRKTYL